MKTESIDIGEYRYTVTQILADEGVPLFCTMLNLVMGSNFNTIEQLVFGAFRNKDLAAAVKVFYTAFAPLTQVSQVNGSGKAVQLDSIFGQHFAGNYDHFTKWLVFCFKLNLGERFLSDIQAAVLKGTPLDSSSPKSPETSG